MKKFLFNPRFQLAATLVFVILDSISYALIFLPNHAGNIYSRAIFWGVITFFLILSLSLWILRLEGEKRQVEEKKPIIGIKNFGHESKTMYLPTGISDKQGGIIQEMTNYDTAFIDFFIEKGNIDALQVWAKVDWFDKEQNPLLTHQGRWHILKPWEEKDKEKLQFRNIYSNGHPERLHFACLNLSHYDGCIYALERERGGKESWENKKYRIGGGSDARICRITLQGKQGVKQSFFFLVYIHDKSLCVDNGEMWRLPLSKVEKD
jgi:hypothetical protein